MTITLTPELEQAIVQSARRDGIAPETMVLDAIREKLAQGPLQLAKILEPRDDWERRLLGVGTPCGVAVSDEALSSEGLYD